MHFLQYRKVSISKANQLLSTGNWNYVGLSKRRVNDSKGGFREAVFYTLYRASFLGWFADNVMNFVRKIASSIRLACNSKT
jgi:hypothetical protein